MIISYLFVLSPHLADSKYVLNKRFDYLLKTLNRGWPSDVKRLSSCGECGNVRIAADKIRKTSYEKSNMERYFRAFPRILSHAHLLIFKHFTKFSSSSQNVNIITCVVTKVIKVSELNRENSQVQIGSRIKDFFLYFNNDQFNAHMNFTNRANILYWYILVNKS